MLINVLKVSDSIQRQEGLERRINSTYLQFQEETQNTGTSERDNFLKDLAAGYDAYMELRNNLVEGAKVYLVLKYKLTLLIL